MCDPITLAVGIGGLTAYGEYQQGNMDLAVAKYNARQQENAATRVRNAATDEENKRIEAGARLMSTQRAQLAASGRDVGAVDSLDIYEDTATTTMDDALMIRQNAEEQASVMEENAAQTLLTGRNQLRMSRIKAVANGVQAGVTTYAAAGGFVA